MSSAWRAALNRYASDPGKIPTNKTSETTSKGVERAAEILNVAREVFARDGYAKLSMRGVAARAGVTLGTVQHYYATKESLFEAMLLHMLEDMQAQADSVAHADASSSPEEQFRQAMRYFIEMLQSPLEQGTFSELKALSLRDPFVNTVMEKIFERGRRSIAQRIRLLDPQLGIKARNLRASLVLAQLMGLTYGQSKGLEEASIETMLSIARGGSNPERD